MINDMGSVWGEEEKKKSIEAGLDCKWTKKEEEEYLNIRRREIGSIYAEQDIRIDQPKERAVHLIEKVLVQRDYELIPHGDGDISIQKFVEIYGKAAALRKLEDIVYNKFF